LGGREGGKQTTGLSGNLGFSKDNLLSWSKLGFLSVFFYLGRLALSIFRGNTVVLFFPFVFQIKEEEKRREKKKKKKKALTTTQHLFHYCNMLFDTMYYEK
jgi:hypothetical protein